MNAPPAQAVALAQLGLRPAFVAVAGDDETGRNLIGQADRDGVDTSAVVRRPGTRTGLIVDVVDPAGRGVTSRTCHPPFC